MYCQPQFAVLHKFNKFHNFENIFGISKAQFILDPKTRDLNYPMALAYLRTSSWIRNLGRLKIS